MKKLRNPLFGLYVVLCLLAMTGPGYSRFGNSVEPYVFGLPFSLIWVVLWVILTFCALLAYYLTDDAAKDAA